MTEILILTQNGHFLYSDLLRSIEVWTTGYSNFYLIHTYQEIEDIQWVQKNQSHLYSDTLAFDVANICNICGPVW